ncbi:hypothetical protein Tco_0078418 [Tanacetum coccineum]
MTKQGNFTQRTPQAKKQSDQASKQVSKQAYWIHQCATLSGPSSDGTIPGGQPSQPPQSQARRSTANLGRPSFQEATKKRSTPDPTGPTNFIGEDEVLLRHRKERRREDNRRPPVFGRIGKQVSGTQTANLQNLNAHENNEWRISVHDRLGSRAFHSSLEQRRIRGLGSGLGDSSEIPPCSTPRTVRRKRRRQYREDEDMSLPWRRQKVDAFTRRISDFSEDKRRRMPANVKTYDVNRRQGEESTSAYVERYKDECIHVKACPEILKISGFMNGINNPELIKRLNDRVPQTFDELMKRTRSFIQGEAAAADSRKGYSNNRSQEQSRRQSNDQSSSRNNSYRGQRGGRGNDKYTPLTMTPKEILATEGANFPRPPPMRTPEEQRVGNGYCEYHRQKGHTTNECVQLRQLIDKLVKEGRLDHLVKNIKEGKDKQRSGGKKDAPRDKADTIYMVQSWQRKTKQKVSQKFSHGSGISFPTLTADNVVVEPLTIEINAAGHDIHHMYIDGGASADILYKHCFQRLLPEVKSQSPSPYNGIIGRPGISAIRAVPSTAHGMLKFPVDGGIVTIYNTAAPPKECNTVTCDVT